MIYAQGDPVTIEQNCGQYPNPSNPKFALTLVKVKYLDPPHECGWQFAELLKADDGWQEIERATRESPSLGFVSDDELREALIEAS